MEDLVAVRESGRWRSFLCMLHIQVAPLPTLPTTLSSSVWIRPCQLVLTHSTDWLMVLPVPFLLSVQSNPLLLWQFQTTAFWIIWEFFPSVKVIGPLGKLLVPLLHLHVQYFEIFFCEIQTFRFANINCGASLYIFILSIVGFHWWRTIMWWLTTMVQKQTWRGDMWPRRNVRLGSMGRSGSVNL